MAFSWTCGFCGFAVAANPQWNHNGFNAVVCPSCAKGTMVGPGGATYPPSRDYAPVSHLPEEVDTAWNEASSAFGAGAYTAAEIMCRKILMHVAVDVAESEPGKNFMQYIDDLDSAGYVAKGLKPKVDEIRTRGNLANHELPASTKADSEKTMSVTRHLLVSIYELPNS